MSKQTERPEWMPKKKFKHDSSLYGPHYADGWNAALDAVVEAMEKAGVVYVDKKSLEFIEWYWFWEEASALYCHNPKTTEISEQGLKELSAMGNRAYYLYINGLEKFPINITAH